MILTIYLLHLVFIRPRPPPDFFPPPNNNNDNDDDDNFPPLPSCFPYSAHMPPVNEFLTPSTTPQNVGGSVIGELEKPKKKKLILMKILKHIFDVDESLDNYLNIGEGGEEEEKNINYQEIKKKVDKGKTSHELNFFVGGKNANFEKKARLLNLNVQNLKF